MVQAIAQEARDGDHVLVMSNGGFGGIHGKLLAALAAGARLRPRRRRGMRRPAPPPVPPSRRLRLRPSTPPEGCAPRTDAADLPARLPLVVALVQGPAAAGPAWRPLDAPTDSSHPTCRWSPTGPSRWSGTRSRPAAADTLVGSSLGGCYATWLAEQTGCRAVLLNPAVHPARDLATQVGPQTGYHDGQPFEFRQAYVDQLRSYEVARITRPERYFLVAAQGDEVLDWREMVAALSGCAPADHRRQRSWPVGFREPDRRGSGLRRFRA